jgi:hypothetical protein
VLGQNTKLLGENIYFLKHRLTASSIFAWRTGKKSARWQHVFGDDIDSFCACSKHFSAALFFS